MDFQQYLEKLFRVKSYDLSKESHIYQNKLLGSFAGINALNSSTSISELLKFLVEDIKKYSNLFIKCIKDAKEQFPDISDINYNDLRNIYLRNINVRIEENKNRLLDFISSTSFSGPKSKSFLSGFEYGVNEIIKITGDEIELLLTDNKTSKEINEFEMVELMKNNQVWVDIEKEFGVTKVGFGKRINFVQDKFKRSIIFRDIEQAYILASMSFSKPAVILAGSVIEELLRLYLESNNVKVSKKDFNNYIKACEENGLLKSAISRLSDSVRYFRNIVHLEKEKSVRYTISKATAKGAVSSIFTISNDF